MAWSGTGTFDRNNGTNSGQETWQDDAAGVGTILADRHDAHDQDLADGIAACITKNGESKATATQLPATDGDLNLGSANYKWNDIYAKSLTLGTGVVEKYYDTLDLAVADAANISTLDKLKLDERVSGYGGGAGWNVISDVGNALAIADGQYSIVTLKTDVSIQLRVDNTSTVDTFGATGVGDDTDAIQAYLNYFTTPLGGVVYLTPGKKYAVTNLTIPVNVTLSSYSVFHDQDEGAVYGYDSFYGAVLFVSGTITRGHGSGLLNIAVLASHLNGYSIPTTDGEANTLVAAFTGTALTMTGTGTITRDSIFLGFAAVNSDSGNRHRFENVKFDCTAGIVLGGGSDVSRAKDCHAWPYLTAELGLSASVNYRSGVAFLIQNNADSYSLNNCYSFGHEVGYRMLGSLGNVVQSPNLVNCRADSGAIGASGTSIGFDVGNYTAYPELINPEAQGNDINFKNDTQGADIGGGERLNRTTLIGGQLLEAADRFCVIDNGRVSFLSTTFGKGSTSTAVFDWNTADGGQIIGCDFMEMYSSSGTGLVFDPANTTIGAAVKRIANIQNSGIHADNRMQDTAASSESFGVSVAASIGGTGEVTIPHLLGKTPVYVNVSTRGDSALEAQYISVDATNITARIYNISDGSDVTTGTIDVMWLVKDND